MRGLAAIGVLALLLAACAPKPRPSPAMLVCTRTVAMPSSIQRRVSACTGLIQTAKGDDLRLALRARGEAYRAQANYAAAMQDFNRALALKSDDDAALDGRGLAFMAQGDLARAGADFDLAIRVNPNGAAGYNNRGIVERRRGDLTGALRDANRAIELSPGTANHWASRGLVYLAKRRFELAIADFADALRIDPNLVSALDGQGDAERAKGDIAGALQAYNQAATAYFNIEQYRRALTESDKALAAKPDDAESLNNRCWTRAVGNFELNLALADCERSLALRPVDANTLDSQAFVRFRMGQFSQAIAGYDAALTWNPKLAPSMFMRGVAKLRAGDTDGGQADIDAAGQMDSSVAGQFASYGVRP
jgi:tetratricopeptide (TPR) repeat protein